jgi:hypothetical protein
MKIRFNALDVLICVMIFAVAFGATTYLGTGGLIMASNNKTVYFTAEFISLPVGFHEKMSIGDVIEDREKGYYYGVVSDIRVEQTEMETLDGENRRMVKTPVPERETIYLTVQSDGTESETEIRASGHLIKIGQRMTLKGKGYAMGGFIVEIRTE